MQTYSRWKNAHPRDYKIDDIEMLKFLALLLFSPFLVVVCWVHALGEAMPLIVRGRFSRAFAYAVLTPFLATLMVPGYLRSRWLRITG